MLGAFRSDDSGAWARVPWALLGWALFASLAVACSTSDGEDDDGAEAVGETGSDAGTGKRASCGRDEELVGAWDGSLGVLEPLPEDGSLPPDLVVGCEAGPVFLGEDLETIPPLAEAGPGGVDEAAQAFLSTEEGTFWPEDGWRVLRQTDAAVVLVQKDVRGFWFLEFCGTAGDWNLSAATSVRECPLHFALPQGLHGVNWRLDPDALPDENTTELQLLITEANCVSGQELGDRLLEPQILMTDTSLRIALAAEPPPGDFFNCPSNPETSITIELPEPLGDREVFEGLAIGVHLDEFFE